MQDNIVTTESKSLPYVLHVVVPLSKVGNNLIGLAKSQGIIGED